MHEGGYVGGILDAVLARAAGRPVAVVRVQVGARHQIKADALRMSFDHVAEGTVAQGAAVEMAELPLVLDCGACLTQSETLDPWSRCPSCDSPRVRLSGGEAIVLESITLHPPA